MIPTQAEMDAPLSPGELGTLADVIQIELTGDTTHLLPWLGLLSGVQKAQLWETLSSNMRSQLQRLSQEAVCAPS